MRHKYWMLGLPRYGILFIKGIKKTDDSLMLELNCYPFKIFFRIENELYCNLNNILELEYLNIKLV